MEFVPKDAVTLDVVDDATGLVRTVNVAEDAPATTVTLGGTETALELEDRLRTVPAGGANPERVTVPVAEAPPGTEFGETEIEATVDEITVRLAFLVTPPKDAEIVAVTEVATPEVEAVNVAVVAPPATVTVAGNPTTALPEPKLTVSPADGAALPIVTVPVEFVPPTTETGLKLRPVSVGGRIVREAVCLVEPSVAVMVTTCCTATAELLIVKLALVALPGIVTVCGSETAELGLPNETAKPPDGAAPLMVTVPVELPVPVTVLGETLKLTRLGDVIVRVTD